ncbi:MAG: hypothetical protein MK486_01600 [Gemmatimonadetes bacterium]|nr:hypothetical protein [Gemmatimonadota bacterium]
MNPRALPVALLPMVLAACGDRTSPILEELAITANANPSAPLAASVLVRTNDGERASPSVGRELSDCFTS